MMRNARIRDQVENYQAPDAGGDIEDRLLTPGDAFCEPGEAHVDLDDSGDPDDSDDPVIAEYEVFVNQQLKGQIHLLQYVNRDGNQPYSEAGNAKPLEIRFKPKAGLVETDIPMNVHSNYDREKGIHWGEAMRKSRLEKGGDSFGLAGGFGIGSASGGRATGPGVAARAAGKSNGGDDITQEALFTNFDDAINKGRVLFKQTLGGITNSKDSIQPNYYIGAFRNSMSLHLLPSNGRTTDPS